MIGNNVLYYMKLRNMKQAELAQKSGLSQSALSYIINGRSEPKEATIAELARVLGVTYSDLADAEDVSCITCPRCGSKTVLAWSNYENHRYRLKCGYCEADTGEQKDKATAVRIFQSFRKVEKKEGIELHVLTKEELLDGSAYDGEYMRCVWLENRGLFVVPSLLQCGIAEREGNYVRAEWHNSYGLKTFDLKDYGNWWRCWNDKPTAEQSESVPWE